MGYTKYILVLLISNLMAMGFLGQCGQQKTDGQQTTTSDSGSSAISESSGATSAGSSESETGEVGEIPDNDVEF